MTKAGSMARSAMQENRPEAEQISLSIGLMVGDVSSVPGDASSVIRESMIILYWYQLYESATYSGKSLTFFLHVCWYETGRDHLHEPRSKSLPRVWTLRS